MSAHLPPGDVELTVEQLRETIKARKDLEPVARLQRRAP